MTSVQGHDEQERLSSLHALQIVKSERRPEYDAIVETAAAVFGSPIALISFVDEDEQWFKARWGLDVEGTPRALSLCQYAIRSDDILVVQDATQDDRFKSNPLVTGASHIRFYAGRPLSIDGKNRLGTLCVIDTKTQAPSEAQLRQLDRLGTVVEGLLSAHQTRLEAEKAIRNVEAEREAASRERDLHAEVAHVSGVGGWEFDLQTHEMIWSEKTRDIHEVAPDFVPTADLALTFFDADRQRMIKDAMRRGADEGVGWDLELPFVTAKGRDLWIRAAGRPVFEGGKVTRLIGAFQDITARKLADQRLRHSEAVQRTTLEALSEGLVLVNRSGQIQSSNPAAAELLGHSPEELRGKKIHELALDVHCEENGHVSCCEPFKLAATSPEKIRDLTVRLCRKPQSEHQTIWLRLNAKPIGGDENFGLDGVVVTMTDITETKRQLDMLQVIFDNLPGGLVYYDDNRRLAVCNEHFRSLLQLPEHFIRDNARLEEVMTYLAARGDYGPGDPKALVEARFEQINMPAPYDYERVSPDGTVLEVHGIPLKHGGLVISFLDITERKRTEQMVRHSEAVHRTTLEALNEGILLLSHTGEFRSVNPAAARLLGYAEDQLVGQNVSDVDFGLSCVLEGMGECVAPLLQAAKDPLSLQNVATKLILSTGERARWLKLTARPIAEDREFGLDGVVVSLADITETKQQSETLQAIFDNFPGGLVHYDNQRRLASWNTEFEQILKLPKSFLETKPLLLDVIRYLAERGDYGPGDPEEIALDRVSVFGAGSRHAYERETVEGRVVEVRGTPLPDGSHVASFFDITERKQAEKAIQISEVVHRTTLESLNEGVLLLDRSGVIVSCNPAAADMFGYALETLVGQRPRDLGLTTDFSQEGKQVDPFLLAAEDPDQVTDVIVRLTPYGQATNLWLRFNAKGVDQTGDRKTETVVLSLADITETKNQADQLHAIFENVPGGFAYFDENLQLKYYNKDFETLLGFPKSLLDQELNLLDYHQITAERGDYGSGDPEQLALQRLRDFPPGQRHAIERATADGNFVDLRSTPLPSGGVIFNFFDITERKEIERQLAQNERLARLRSQELEGILANMRQGVSVFDKHGRLTLWNQRYIDIFGRLEDDIKEGITLTELLVAEELHDAFDGDPQNHVMDLMIRMSSGETVRSKFKHPNGKVISVVHTPLPDGGWIGTHEDITLSELAVEKIEHAAHHDTLTGLANRTLFNAKLEEALSQAARTQTQGNLMLLDLDKFKPVNDSFGHDAGDELLRQVADRLWECVRSSDLVARLGGDEFGIILGQSGDDVATGEVADRIVRRIQTPFNINGQQITIGVSVGISQISGETLDVNPVIKRADIALYEVKNDGRNGYKFFNGQPSSSAAVH